MQLQSYLGEASTSPIYPAVIPSSFPTLADIKPGGKYFPLALGGGALLLVLVLNKRASR